MRFARASSVFRATVIVSLALSGCDCGGDGGPGPGVDAGGSDASLDATRSDTGPAEVDAGAPDTGPGDAGPIRPICEPCTDHAQCGDLGRCVTFTTGERACVATCNPDIPTCPRGFDCVLNFSAPDVTTCVPIGDSCCVDEDADGYGDGIGCLGRDCNDTELGINPGADERCNGMDDDCDGLIDDLATDCSEQDCRSTMLGTFEEAPPGSCSTDGMCIDPAPRACGLFTCADGSDLGTSCATSCLVDTRDDDSRCIGPAHCDAEACVADLTDGEACDEDSDCTSGHCDNGFCCTGGICCRVVADCPMSPGGLITTCDDATTCQGSRGEALCTGFVCSTRAGVPDDSACDSSVEADTCGFFRSIFCTGAADQPTPRCPTTCGSDSECDAGAHCDTVCVPDLPDGDACDEDGDCISSHCNNNICCASGDCCRNAGDCPSFYSSPARCETPSACQGTRDAAACGASICSTITNVPDDSACSPATLADDCGPYPSLYCNGTTDQPSPTCAAACSADSECDAPAHCDGSACVPDLADGRMCDEPSDCVSGHCQNGFCCASGDCCNMGSDCPTATYGAPSTCDDATTCQGRRRDPLCTPAKQCALGPMVDDDSGCVGLLANACGPYPSVLCTSAMMQPPTPGALCANSCMGDGDCDPGAHCAGGACVADGDPGDPCTMSRECSSGLACVDNVCCTSSCTGTCRACNVAGSLGTCVPVPGGTDPGGECAGVSCSAYYWGYGPGEICYRRADAPDSEVDCDGTGACEDAADVCPGRSSGEAQIDCNDACQDPTPGTCTSMTPGACTNTMPVPNSQTCGTGACARTSQICDMGAPVTCIPGAPASETCNDADDDCNGVTDEGLAQDGLEYNDVCASAYNPGTVYTLAMGAGEPSTRTIRATLYGSGDVDIYRVPLQENDSSCGCGSICGWGPCTDEDYAITARLAVPVGAGSYQLCNVQGACNTSNCVTVAEGATASLTAWLDDSCCIVGSCNASGDWFVQVRPLASPGFECREYTLTVFSEQGCR